MSSENVDVVVIGSGLGGLSAAAYAAAAGKRVMLLERYSTLGGSSHVYRRFGKYEFDCGVHYIGDCGPEGNVPTLLRSLGLEGRVEFEPLDADGFDRIIAPDFELKVPVGWEAYEASLHAAFPKEAKAIRRYVRLMRLAAASQDRVWSPASASGQRKAVTGAGRAAPWMMAPLATMMVACGLSPRAVLVLSVECGAQATTSMTLPVAAGALYLQNFVQNAAYYPRGGGQMFSAAFADVIRAHGGAIRTNAEVRRIVIEGGTAVGVELVDGEIIRSGSVISDADVLRTYDELVGAEHLPRRTRLNMKRMVMSRPLINGFFGVEIDIQSTPNANYFAIPTWDDAKSFPATISMVHDLSSRSQRGRDGLEWAEQFSARQPMFVQCSTRRDPNNLRSAPAGHAAIEVQTIVPSSPALWGYEGQDPRTGEYRNGAQYRAIKEIVTEGMLDRLDQVYPGASANVKLTELGTPATQTRFTATSAGAAFGLDTRSSQFGIMRPGPRTPIKGLFLAGTSTPWGSGTEGSMISGVFAASEMTGRDLATAVFKNREVLVDPSILPARGADFDPLSTTRRLGGKPSPVFDETEA